MTQWCVSRVGLYAVLAVGFLPKMNCLRHALAHALIKKDNQSLFETRLFGVCRFASIIFSSILFRDEESSC